MCGSVKINKKYYETQYLKLKSNFFTGMNTIFHQKQNNFFRYSPVLLQDIKNFKQKKNKKTYCHHTVWVSSPWPHLLALTVVVFVRGPATRVWSLHVSVVCRAVQCSFQSIGRQEECYFTWTGKRCYNALPLFWRHKQRPNTCQL